MLTPRRSAQFKRDVRKLKKRGKGMGKLRALLAMLLEQQALPERYRDHPLHGTWAAYREAHLEPDWLLVYRVVNDELQLARTGTHADLFDE